MAPKQILRRLLLGADALPDRVAGLFSLAIRLYVAKAFFMSGLVKIQSWDSTLALFENEYQVPLLSPVLAAWLGTAAELALPVLLAAGLCSRFTAAALFVFNIVAVASYPDISPAGLKDHLLWGWLMAVIFTLGAGRISVDAWLHRRFDPASR